MIIESLKLCEQRVFQAVKNLFSLHLAAKQSSLVALKDFLWSIKSQQNLIIYNIYGTSYLKPEIIE